MVIKHINKYKKLIIIVKIGNLKTNLRYAFVLKFAFSENSFISASSAFMLIAAVLSFSSKNTIHITMSPIFL